MRRLAALGLVIVASAASAGPIEVASATRDPDTLIAHEWGTFTSVAGENGEAIDWWTLGGPQDLPCFVERLRTLSKSDQSGTVRMETPVVYFYSPRQTTVDVTVRFHAGTITEWYPRATVSTLAKHTPHTLRWTDVKVRPSPATAFPREAAASHYYAARATDAAPVQVGDQHEKFLFYRGVGRFAIPLAARLTGENRVVVTTKGPEPLPAVILFENRGGKLRYQARGSLAGEAAVELPARTSDFNTLAAHLETVLVAQGLYVKEARAMIDTWRDSWFEEGTRLFYIVPQSTIDAVLPLAVTPRPSAIARVFVGRVELLTPATLADVSGAIERNDVRSAARYGRFLPAIVERVLPLRQAAPDLRARADRVLAPIYTSLATPVTRCQAGASRAATR